MDYDFWRTAVEVLALVIIIGLWLSNYRKKAQIRALQAEFERNFVKLPTPKGYRCDGRKYYYVKKHRELEDGGEYKGRVRVPIIAIPVPLERVEAYVKSSADAKMALGLVPIVSTNSL